MYQTPETDGKMYWIYLNEIIQGIYIVQFLCL